MKNDEYITKIKQALGKQDSVTVNSLIAAQRDGLHLIVMDDDLGDFFGELISAIDVNMQNCEGNTLLHLLLGNVYVGEWLSDMLRALLRSSPNVSLKNKEGAYPITLLAQVVWNEVLEPETDEAFSSDQAAELIESLLPSDFNIDAPLVRITKDYQVVSQCNMLQSFIYFYIRYDNDEGLKQSLFAFMKALITKFNVDVNATVQGLDGALGIWAKNGIKETEGTMLDYAIHLGNRGDEHNAIEVLKFLKGLGAKAASTMEKQAPINLNRTKLSTFFFQWRAEEKLGEVTAQGDRISSLETKLEKALSAIEYLQNTVKNQEAEIKQLQQQLQQDMSADAGSLKQGLFG
ncbi:MAG: hypothetical protein COB66_03650 [Coxiella sp. (in: Bacteria)]|nr:MAG: hypothetical protein COB66_03650 [Coxiella sp. (in: g-proteobacteria)]